MSSRAPMRSLARAARTAALCGLLAAFCGCKDEQPARPSVGTNSNWLRACSNADECGDLPACECGACTANCANDGECGAIEDARCALGADPAAWAECESRSPALAAGLCLPRCDPGSCGDGQACVSGACVLAPLPATPFCADVADQDAGLRTREEELLALLQEMRSEGGAPCEGSAPAPALRLDPRLSCAARVWAADIDATRAPGVEDSQGRTTEDRTAAAGYAARLWGDSFALDARSAAHALELMTAGDAGVCASLTDPDQTDVGVGAAGDVLVITTGAE